MWGEPPPLFPDWFAPEDVDSEFVVVDGAADIVVTTVSYHLTLEDLARYRSFREPLVVFYTLDDLNEPVRGGWRRPAEWAAGIRDLALSADLLVGAQLPADLRHRRFLALPHAPVVPFAPAPGAIASASTDIYFSGAWYPPPDGKVPRDSRDRAYRAYLVERLRAGLPGRTLDLRRVHFWRTNPLDPGGPPPERDLKADLLRQHREALDRTRISLAPVGYGYLTTRHADTFARGRPLLTEPIQRYIHLPEPDRWEAGEFAIFYRPEDDDIAEVVDKALGDPARLNAVAEAGWHYAQRHLRPDRQIRRLAAAIRHMIGG
jgi:hypothetical protein